MKRYLSQRLLLTIPILLGVSVIVFFTVQLVPGDPIATMVGAHATPETRHLMAHRYGLDRALPVQYVLWLGNALQGDLGASIARQTDVSGIVATAFTNTLTLTLFAASIAVVVGAGLAMAITFSRRRTSRMLSSIVSLASVSMPQYSLGVIVIVVFAANLAWFPAGGMHDVLAPDSYSSLVHHLILPGLTAAAIPTGIIARMFSAALAEESQEPYVDNLRARGLSEWRVRRHIVHGSLASLLTISGLQIGYLLGGVVFVEVVFAWPGIGELVYESISRRDYPVIQAGILVSALAFVITNLVVDVARAALDPRVRASGVTA
ncbi:MAG: ABC-type transporter, integral rane subunit [Frankiales bacterium]|nr:ABC-type transporter, integral rane subunit [Frankiales bacterium]